MFFIGDFLARGDPKWSRKDICPAQSATDWWVWESFSKFVLTNHLSIDLGYQQTVRRSLKIALLSAQNSMDGPENSARSTSLRGTAAAVINQITGLR